MKVVWYERGTNALKQVVYESDSAAEEVYVAQLNNVLLIKDNNIIAKCIFDVTENRYKTAISDLPALPKMTIEIKDDYVTDKNLVTQLLKFSGFKWASVNSDGSVPVCKRKTLLTAAEKQTTTNQMRDYFRWFNTPLFSNTIIKYGTNFCYDPDDKEALRASLAGKYKLLTESKKKYYAGYVFLSYAFELFDGSITKPSPPRMILLGDEYNKDMLWAHTIDIGDDTTSFSVTMAINNYHVGAGVPNIRENKIGVSSITVSFSAESLDYDKDIIKSVVVYCSKPLNVYDFENLEIEYLHYVLGPAAGGDDNDFDVTVKNGYTGYTVSGDESGGVSALAEGRYNFAMDLNLEKEGLVPTKFTESVLNSIILYRVERFYTGEKKDLSRELDLSSVQSNENIPVDSSGWWNTSGEMFLYNQRLHLFNYRQEFKQDANGVIQTSWISLGIGSLGSFGYGSAVSTANVIIKTEGEYINVIMRINVVYRIENNKLSIYLSKYIAFPDARAERVDFYIKISGKIYKATQNLIASKIMNIAYSSNMNNEDKYSILDCVEVDEIPDSQNLVYYNNTNIIVSELNNPFYFPVSQSYQAGAAVVQLAVAHEEITSSQVGQYPLYAFTTERIFALEAGSGATLYGRVVPVSAEVCINKNVLQTKMGIVFVAASGLKVISGRTILDISDVIEKNLDLNVRVQTGTNPSPYIQALSNSSLVVMNNNLSAVVFDEYMKEAVFGYDINNNEIIVSNSKYSYSYIYELNSRIWHKITEAFDMLSYGIGLTKADAAGLRNVVNLKEETGETAEVLIQTRPINLDSYSFKAIRRLAVRGEISPVAGSHFGFYSFGSNNLRNYIMTSAKQSGNYFGVLFAERVQKWHRYYVILCAGKVFRNSAISHFEIEGEEKINSRDR
jgi:hypothetical protein